MGWGGEVCGGGEGEVRERLRGGRGLCGCAVGRRTYCKLVTFKINEKWFPQFIIKVILCKYMFKLISVVEM